MRKNDFFKYLLFGRGSGSSASQSELEAENFPYTFTSDSHTLRNYRIYGDENGVGDLDSTTNKYVIPVEINGTAVNISLDSPLNDGDYIDFREQKRFNSDDSSEIISLPVLPILSGINVIDVGTENQPSKVYVQGNISAFSVSSWANVQKLVRAGLHDKYFAVGDQLVCQKGNSDLTWDIIGFDHDTPTDSQYTHSMTLQLHDCLPSTMQFDAPEALYYAENGLAAGTYNFTIQSGYDTAYGGGKTYQFTLTNAVEPKGQLTFGWGYGTQAANAKITIYDKNGNQVGSQIGVTEGNTGTSLGTTDGNSQNVNHIHKIRYGSNNYGKSAIRQFLNSSAAAGSVWESQDNQFDRPPAWNSNTAGFMSDLDSDFLAVVGSVHKIACINNVTDGGGSAAFDDKFFLLSRSEVYGGNEVTSVDEGSPYPYYSDYSDLSEAGTGNDSNRIKYRSGTAQTWRLRSPYSAVGGNVRNISQTGGIGQSDAGSSVGVSPVCNIV